MIPILNVSLPTADQLYPYLKQIDSFKVYSNYGPLYQELIKNVSKLLCVNDSNVVGVSSATSGLQLSLLEIAERDKQRSSELVVAVPNWTFSATPQAALSLGCNVVLLDTDTEGFISLDDVVTLEIAGTHIDVVILVSPFGAKIPEKKWMDASLKYKFEVVVDAAACFFNASLPSGFVHVVSTHATKGFSTGEGGLVISPNSKQSKRIAAMANFGFSGARESQNIGQNSKLSEYASAVGLAMLPDIAELKNKLLRQVEYYDNSFSKSEVILPFSSPYPRTTYSIYLQSCSKKQVDQLMLQLYLDRGIEVRRWWNQPISNQPIGKKCLILAPSLQNSIHFSETVIGIPIGTHITDYDQSFIVKSLLEDTVSYCTTLPSG